MLRLTFFRSRWHYEMFEPCYLRVFPFISHLLRALWFNLTLVACFFGRSLTRAKVYFPFSSRSFRCHANKSPFMCGSGGKRWVISLSYHTNMLFIIDPLSYNTMYPSWHATSYNCPPSTMSMWSYHWWSR